jgi:hypothetical protein
LRRRIFRAACRRCEVATFDKLYPAALRWRIIGWHRRSALARGLENSEELPADGWFGRSERPEHLEPAAIRVAALLAQAVRKPHDRKVAPAPRNVLARRFGF